MKYSEEDIKLALVAITQNNESVSEACKKYNIPVEILENSLLDFKQRHITNETILHNGTNPFNTEEISVNKDALKGILNNQQIISFEKAIEQVHNDKVFSNSDDIVFEDSLNKNQEFELTNIIIELYKQFCGITELDMRRIIFEYFELNGINHNFDKEMRLTSEKWCSQFIQSHPRLSNIFQQTKITPHHDFTNDTSNLNHLVVDKFLREYKSEKKCSKNEFNVEDFEFSLPCLLKKDEAKNVDSNLENTNILIPIKENYNLKVPLVFHDANGKNATVARENDMNQSEVDGNNGKENSDIKSINSYENIEENNVNLLSESQKIDHSSVEKFPVLSFEDTIDDISDPMAVNKNENSTSSMQYIHNNEEKPASVARENMTVLNEGNSDSVINSCVSGIEYYNHSISDALGNPGSSSDLSTFDFGQQSNPVNSSFQVCDGGKIPVQNKLLCQSDTKPSYEMAAALVSVPAQNYEGLNFFQNSINPISVEVPFKIENVDQTNILPEIINNTLNYPSSVTHLGESNCIKNLDASMNCNINFDTIPCEFDSSSVKSNELSAVNTNEENVHNLSTSTSVDGSHLNKHSTDDAFDSSTSDVRTDIPVGDSQDSNFSHSEVSQKKLESDTSLDKKSHVIRKKKRSKKTVASGASKPKKSKYLYKLKSFNGSVLYFTSPTSVSFIKPKITLTKLNESEYLPTPKEGNVPENELCLNNPLSFPEKDSATNSENYSKEIFPFNENSLEKIIPKISSPEEIKPEIPPTEEILPEIPPPEEILPEIPPPEKILPEIPPPEKILSEIPSPDEMRSEIPSPKELLPEICPSEEILPKLSPSEVTIPEITETKETSTKISTSMEVSPPEEISSSRQPPQISSKKTVKKINITENENSTPTFSMQTRKKRLRFLPDGTLVTAKQEFEDRILSSPPATKSGRKRAHKNTSLSTDKKNKVEIYDEVKSDETTDIKRKPRSKTPSEPKYIPKYNGPSKKPQKIFDYDSYYREKSNIENPSQPKKVILPPSYKKQTVAFNRIKSISESAKSGELVVNPAHLLSCLLGMPINENQICTVRFKPPAEQRTPNNRVNVTPSKLASDNNAIKPIAKRQLELLQRNNAFSIFPSSEESSKSVANSKTKILNDKS